MKDEEQDNSKEKPNEKKNKPNNSKENVAWVGTSISKALDRKKFERDTNRNIKFVKAFGITEEIKTPYPKEEFRYPNENFRKIVPEVLEDKQIDTLVMQTGSIEITNIKVNQAIMDTSKSIDEYKKEWFNQAEEDSKNIFNIAEEAIKKRPNMKVVILKRLPRFDRSSQDIIGIKAKLSAFANSAYDQLWLKNGSPSNIHIAELNLNSERSTYLKHLLFGSEKFHHVDGIHLRGPGAVRHFTYRAIQAVKPVLRNSSPYFRPARFTSRPSASKDKQNTGYRSRDENKSADNHTDCPQAQFQRKSAEKTQESVMQRQPRVKVVISTLCLLLICSIS